MDIKSTNGDIYIYKPDVAGTLNIITDNGDLYTSKANIKGKLEINTHNGDVDAGSLGISGETKILIFLQKMVICLLKSYIKIKEVKKELGKVTSIRKRAAEKRFWMFIQIVVIFR